MASSIGFMMEQLMILLGLFCNHSFFNYLKGGPSGTRPSQSKLKHLSHLEVEI